MTAHPSRWPEVPKDLDELVTLLTRQAAEARETAGSYDLDIGDRHQRAHYHDGRADAFDVALYEARQAQHAQKG